MKKVFIFLTVMFIFLCTSTSSALSKEVRMYKIDNEGVETFVYDDGLDEYLVYEENGKIISENKRTGHIIEAVVVSEEYTVVNNDEAGELSPYRVIKSIDDINWGEAAQTYVKQIYINDVQFEAVSQISSILAKSFLDPYFPLASQGVELFFKVLEIDRIATEMKEGNLENIKGFTNNYFAAGCSICGKTEVKIFKVLNNVKDKPIGDLTSKIYWLGDPLMYSNPAYCREIYYSNVK